MTFFVDVTGKVVGGESEGFTHCTPVAGPFEEREVAQAAAIDYIDATVVDMLGWRGRHLRSLGNKPRFELGSYVQVGTLDRVNPVGKVTGITQDGDNFAYRVTWDSKTLPPKWMMESELVKVK